MNNWLISIFNEKGIGMFRFALSSNMNLLNFNIGHAFVSRDFYSHEIISTNEEKFSLDFLIYARR